MKTAALCNKSPAEWIGIADPDVADAFNVECADVMFKFELDREKHFYEAMAAGSIASLGGGQSEQVKVEKW